MAATPQYPANKFIPKKSFGQNFLVDKNVCQRILSTCCFHPNDTVLEIGPGQGALTAAIVQRAGRLVAIEKDRRLFHFLQDNLDHDGIQLIHGDVLKYDLQTLPVFDKIIGNLPYNISSPIMEKMFQKPIPGRMFFFTVQAEFARRLTAKPHCKDYGALTCFIEYHAEAQILFHIRNTAFWPVPKVRSSFVRLSPRPFRLKADNEELLFMIIRRSFQQRRKMLINALDSLIAKHELMEILSRLKISPQSRPENLTLTQFIHISNDMNRLDKNPNRREKRMD